MKAQIAALIERANLHHIGPEPIFAQIDRFIDIIAHSTNTGVTQMTLKLAIVACAVLLPVAALAQKGELMDRLPGVAKDIYAPSAPAVITQRIYHDPKRGVVTETCEHVEPNIKSCSETWLDQDDFTRRNVSGIIKFGIN